MVILTGMGCSRLLKLQDGEAYPNLGCILNFSRLKIQEKAEEISMWYVVQTLSGEEEKTADIIKKMVPSEFMEECFVPRRERLKKFCGCWHKVDEVLFCGYAFVASERPRELYEELKRIPKLTKVLGREENYFFALDKREENLVRGIGDGEHKTSLSQIMVGEGKKIQVVDGPLKNYVGDVVKVDLHKREAVVCVEFMGRPMKLKMGIEMVEIKDKNFESYREES